MTGSTIAARHCDKLPLWPVVQYMAQSYMASLYQQMVVSTSLSHDASLPAVAAHYAECLWGHTP